MDRFAEDYINGVEECTSLFEDDDNWNFKSIRLKDKGDDKQQLIRNLFHIKIIHKCERFLHILEFVLQ